MVKAQAFENTWTGAFHKRRKTFIVIGNTKKPCGKHTSIPLARWLMDAGDSELVVDHINRKTLDNRYSNLRMVTNSRNLHNSSRLFSRNKTSGYRGVSYKKDKKKYRAYSKVENKQIHLGYFLNAEDAIERVIEHRKSLGLEIY